MLDFDALKKQLVCMRVAVDLGWTPTQKVVSYWKGPCPFHGSRSKTSTSLHIHQYGYRCHKCGEHGDVFRLASWFWGCSAVEAAIRLAKERGLKIPNIPDKKMPLFPQQCAENGE